MLRRLNGAFFVLQVERNRRGRSPCKAGPRHLMTMEKTTKLIAKHEGLKLKPYKDSVGIWTIGYGRNLEEVGISEPEAESMLKHDVEKAYQQARSFKWFKDLNGPRRAVVVNMIFNLGLAGFSKFEKTILFLERGLYHAASEEMLNSKWAKQVGNRALELSELMYSGEWLDD